MIDQDDERIREVILVTLRVPLHKAAFHAMRDELFDLANLHAAIPTPILLAEQRQGQIHQVVVLGEPRRPVSAVGKVLLAGGPGLDKSDDVLLGRIRKTRRITEIEQRPQESNQVDVIVPRRRHKRLEITVRLRSIAIQNQSRVIERPAATVARVHCRLQLAEVLDNPFEILDTPRFDLPFLVGGIICMHCTEGRQQQGGKECAGGFHGAISDSNAIRKPMEMFL